MKRFTAPEERGQRIEGHELLLWAGVLLGPVAWSLHLLVAYPLVGPACDAGGELLLHATTVVFAILAVLGSVISWRNWRQHGSNTSWSIALQGKHGRAQFMAAFGLINSGFFLIIVLLAGSAVFFIDPCVR
jgi:hypothetical protein